MRVSATISTLSMALLVGACALPDTESFRAPDASSLFRKFSVSGTLNEKVLPPVVAADMVDASGRCSGAYVPAAGDPAAPSDVTLRDAGVPVIPAAIALDMTECDVVKRAGVADKVDIGPGPERTVTLTYLRGERPGIYRFAEGRLRSMELAPDQAPAARVAKKPAKPAKPPARRASQSQVSVQ